MAHYNKTVHEHFTMKKTTTTTFCYFTNTIRISHVVLVYKCPDVAESGCEGHRDSMSWLLPLMRSMEIGEPFLRGG